MKMCLKLILSDIDGYKIFIIMHAIFILYDNYPYNMRIHWK